MTTTPRLRRGRLFRLAVGIAGTFTILLPVAASAVTGDDGASTGDYGFVAKVSRDGKACSGVLISQRWVLTSSTCFPDATAPGTPAQTTVTVGRTDLSAATGQVVQADAVLPRADRNLALLRLAIPVTTVTPLALASQAPQTGDSLRLAGFGRTATEWVPNQLHTTAVTVDSVTATTLTVGSTGGPTTCKGDAGGPALRVTNGTPELVALNHTSWQSGCLGGTETRTGATETRVDDLHDTLTAQMNDPILARYLDLGGASSFLGAAVSDEYTVASGSGQDYQHGSIYYSSATGAHVVQDDILANYKAIGGPAVIGFPLTDQNTTPDGIGRYNHFNLTAGASIYWSPTTGAHAIQGAIRDKWASLGWETKLGYPTTDETPITGIARDSGRYNDFSGSDHASLYWAPSTGVHELQGDIRTKWLALGGAPKLGFPTTDETATPDGVGRYNHFNHPDGVSVYWSPASGAHHIQGAIRTKWADYGWETGFGYPTTDENITPDKIGHYNHFTNNASVYWTPATAAHSIVGRIRDTYAGLGWETSRLAYPTSDEYNVTGGRRNDFQHGNITWTSANNTTQVTYF